MTMVVSQSKTQTDEEQVARVVLPGLSAASDGSASYSSTSELQDAQIKSTRQGNPLVTPAKTMAVSYIQSCDKPTTQNSTFQRHSSLRRISSIGSPTYSPRRAQKKKVAFGDLEMRKYPIVLGDHPDCSSGPPLAIGWEYLEEQKIPVEKYEAMKPRRRSLDDLELNYFTRKRILRRFSGVSDDEIRQATDEVHKVQRQRSRTKRMLPMQKIEETCESVGRKFGNALHIGRRKESRKSRLDPRSAPATTPVTRLP